MIACTYNMDPARLDPKRVQQWQEKHLGNAKPPSERTIKNALQAGNTNVGT